MQLDKIEGPINEEPKYPNNSKKKLENSTINTSIQCVDHCRYVFLGSMMQAVIKHP